MYHVITCIMYYSFSDIVNLERSVNLKKNEDDEEI